MADGQNQFLGQGVNHGHTHTVQAAGDLVAVVVELTAGVQHGHDHFSGGDAFFLVDIHRNATAVVTHTDRLIRVNGDGDFAAVPGQGFVNRVVDHLEHHVVQTAAIVGIADVHTRPLAYGIQALEDLNVIGVVRLVFAHAFTPGGRGSG